MAMSVLAPAVARAQAPRCAASVSGVCRRYRRRWTRFTSSAELIRLRVDAIVAAPTPAVRAALDATHSIPIVMAFGGDPVGEKFVASLARPGGNVTGHSAAVAEMAAKRVEFLKTVSPDISRVALFYTVAEPRQSLQGTEAAGRALNVRIARFGIRTREDVVAAFASMKRNPVDGLVVSLTLQEHWRTIVDLASTSRLPTVSGPVSSWTRAGSWPTGRTSPISFADRRCTPTSS